MKTTIAMCCSALLSVGVLGCMNSDTSSMNDSSNPYGTPSTAGDTIPGNQNSNSNAPAATPRQSNNNDGAMPGINAGSGATGAANQGNNSPDAVSPTAK